MNTLVGDVGPAIQVRLNLEAAHGPGAERLPLDQALQPQVEELLGLEIALGEELPEEVPNARVREFLTRLLTLASAICELSVVR